MFQSRFIYIIAGSLFISHKCDKIDSAIFENYGKETFV